MQSEPSRSEALAEWAAALGEEHVLAGEADRDRYARSTFPRGTRPAAIVRPGCVEEVQAVVRIAARHAAALYPISGGKNWGLGDACAVSDGQVVVDLGRMNRIREVNVPLGYAVVEPGVTQRQMHDYLRANAIPLWFDATGAGPDASILGNLMERGFGHTPVGDRFQNAAGLEVVLADGRLLRTGFGHYASSQVTHVFKAGIGPALDGLFTQSNLGIATSVGVWFLPQPEAFAAFGFSVPGEDQLADVIEALRPLRMQGLLQSTIHVANDLRVISAHHRYPWDRTGGATPLPRAIREELRRRRGLGAWNVLGGLYGTRRSVRAAKHALRRALRGLARPTFVNDTILRLGELAAAAVRWTGPGKRLAELLASLRPAYVLLKGEPAADHLRGTGWRSRRPATADGSLDPLDNGQGLMWLSTSLPQTGAAALDLRNLVEPILARYGFDPLITYVLVSARAMVCPLTICYDRDDPGESARAVECYDALFTAAMERGYIPYRAGIHSMAKLAGGSSVFWDVVREIKRCLDPRQILAPGRYLPPE